MRHIIRAGRAGAVVVMPGAPRRKRPLPSRPEERDLGAADEDSAHDGSLFIWTIIILVLSGIAIACWIGSFYIFGHPEKALGYGILTKLKKLDPPKRFVLTEAPRGEFLRAADIKERFGRMTPRELDKANEALLRNYLRNYKLSSDLVPYVVGTFNILDSYELTSEDFFPTGVVALAQSKVTPDVLLEQVFTADSKVVPALHRTLLTGLDIDLKRENELAALIHVARLDDGRLKATALSILYPSYESTTASGTFTLEPPNRMNVQAGLPVIPTTRVRAADQKYASYRQRAGIGNAQASSTDVPQNRLMRVERPVAVNLATQPEVPTAPAAPVLPEDAPVRQAIPVNPVASAPLPPEPAPTPTATPATSPSPPAVVAATSGSWPVYAPGQMPRGRLLNAKETSTMEGADVASERVYLQGSFVVTASGPNRAVLRNQGAIANALGFGSSGGDMRVIVEFPAGARPPAEGSTFSRDARRPFQITEIRRGNDGQVNVYVREVTKP
ncbi:MAG: hypothetical protein ACOYNN_03265 [Terrimicrobiaceae bacterium]